MGVPTLEVGYTAAMPRREDHEVHKYMWWHWGKRKIKKFKRIGYDRFKIYLPGKFNRWDTVTYYFNMKREIC